LRIADCGLRIDRGLRIVDCGLIEDCDTLGNPKSALHNPQLIRIPQSAIRNTLIHR